MVVLAKILGVGWGKGSQQWWGLEGGQFRDKGSEKINRPSQDTTGLNLQVSIVI